MKVYVVESVTYDYHEFRTIEGVFRTIEEFERLLDGTKPLFKADSPELEKFQDETYLDGFTHFEYEEYEL